MFWCLPCRLRVWITRTLYGALTLYALCFWCWVIGDAVATMTCTNTTERNINQNATICTHTKSNQQSMSTAQWQSRTNIHKIYLYIDDMLLAQPTCGPRETFMCRMWVDCRFALRPLFPVVGLVRVDGVYNGFWSVLLNYDWSIDQCVRFFFANSNLNWRINRKVTKRNFIPACFSFI